MKKRGFDLPRPESNHEAPPAEEEHSSVYIEGVEDGNGTSLVIDGIDLWRLPERRDLETHGDFRGGVVARCDKWSSYLSVEMSDLKSRREVTAQEELVCMMKGIERGSKYPDTTIYL